MHIHFHSSLHCVDLSQVCVYERHADRTISGGDKISEADTEEKCKVQNSQFHHHLRILAMYTAKTAGYFGQ